MIPVVKSAAPAVLLTKGADATRELCNAYAQTPHDYRSGARTFDFDGALYAARAVKEALRDAQHGKCAFCESHFGHITYGDVEHFRPKAGYKQTEADDLKRPGYYWLAYAWDNLYCSCQLCNQRFKRNLFPLKDGRRRARAHTHKLSKEEPLVIDPGTSDPSAHLRFREEYAYAVGGCGEGETTIAVLGLNREELVEARRKRLGTLRYLVLLRELLREKAAATPAPAWTEQLHALDDTLRASREPAGEYAAMARAVLGPAGTGS